MYSWHLYTYHRQNQNHRLLYILVSKKTGGERCVPLGMRAWIADGHELLVDLYNCRHGEVKDSAG